MREILFRGKRLDNNKWYYGSYLFIQVPNYDWTGKASTKVEDVHYIVNQEDINIAVYPETVCQFTGLCDKDGTKIFEGDIVSYREFGVDHKSVVEYEFAEGWYPFGGNYGHYYGDTEIIGNIFDNPELLEDK